MEIRPVGVEFIQSETDGVRGVTDTMDAFGE